MSAYYTSNPEFPDLVRIGAILAFDSITSRSRCSDVREYLFNEAFDRVLVHRFGSEPSLAVAEFPYDRVDSIEVDVD